MDPLVGLYRPYFARLEPFFRLTHLYLWRVDSSTSTLWTGLFPIEECLVSFFIITEFYRNSCPQRRLIRVYTVCQCLFYGTPGLNGINYIGECNLFCCLTNVLVRIIVFSLLFFAKNSNTILKHVQLMSVYYGYRPTCIFVVVRKNTLKTFHNQQRLTKI